MIKYCQRLLYIHVPVYTQLNLKIDACTFDVYKRMIIYHDHDKKKNFPQYIYQLKRNLAIIIHKQLSVMYNYWYMMILSDIYT